MTELKLAPRTLHLRYLFLLTLPGVALLLIGQRFGVVLVVAGLLLTRMYKRVKW